MQADGKLKFLVNFRSWTNGKHIFPFVQCLHVTSGTRGHRSSKEVQCVFSVRHFTHVDGRHSFLSVCLSFIHSSQWPHPTIHRGQALPCKSYARWKAVTPRTGIDQCRIFNQETACLHPMLVKDMCDAHPQWCFF